MWYDIVLVFLGFSVVIIGMILEYDKTIQTWCVAIGFLIIGFSGIALIHHDTCIKPDFKKARLIMEYNNIEPDKYFDEYKIGDEWFRVFNDDTMFVIEK